MNPVQPLTERKKKKKLRTVKKICQTDDFFIRSSRRDNITHPQLYVQVCTSCKCVGWKQISIKRHSNHDSFNAISKKKEWDREGKTRSALCYNTALTSFVEKPNHTIHCSISTMSFINGRVRKEEIPSLVKSQTHTFTAYPQNWKLQNFESNKYCPSVLRNPF